MSNFTSSVSSVEVATPRDDRPVAETIGPEQQPTEPPREWRVAVETLRAMFGENGGIVSSHAFRARLESLGIQDARGWVIRIRHYSFEEPDEQLSPLPDFRWRCHAKSLYTEEAFSRLVRQQEEEAAHAERAGSDSDDECDSDSPRPERRKRRQEESRLGFYVKEALENVYQSEFGSDTYVFDVHAERAGSDMENVDVLAVDWRSAGVVELVAVEVKLDFTAKLVQQARNYQRFAHRVWIAIPVNCDLADAAVSLRDTDPLLFEHVISCGLGILACRRRRGSCYEVAPVHWPRLTQPDPVEKARFVERYRRHLEQAAVVAPQGVTGYPVI